jgi:hypothetical protein
MHRQLYNFCKVSSFADRMKNMQKEIIFSNNTLKGQDLEQIEYGLYTGPKYKLQSKIFDYLLKKLLSAYMDNTINGEKSIKNEDTVSWLVMAQHMKKIRFHFLSQRAWIMLKNHFILCPIQICDSSLSL